MGNELNINEILMRVQERAQAAGVKLTFDNLQVYMALLNYPLSYPQEVAEGMKEYRFWITGKALSEESGVSRTVVYDSLQKFVQCGLIKYISGGKRPSMVYLYKNIE